MAERRKLGEIFIERNILSASTVERMLALSKKGQKRFGALLEEIGLVTGLELAEALALQFNCKTVFNFAQATFPQEVLRVITPETALQHLVFPLKIEPGKLHLAVADPTNSRILHNIAVNNDAKLFVYVSTRAEINAAICRHYFGINVSEPVRKTVLVVDDDKMVVALLRNILSSHYQVHTAEDGMEAYREAVSKRPHVIMTDKEMPKLDGFGLLSALMSVQETRTIPVILLSGTTSAEAEAKAFDLGFFDFIPKPVKETTILTRIKRAFDYCEKHNYMYLR